MHCFIMLLYRLIAFVLDYRLEPQDETNSLETAKSRRAYSDLSQKVQSGGKRLVGATAFTNQLVLSMTPWMGLCRHFRTL